MRGKTYIQSLHLFIQHITCYLRIFKFLESEISLLILHRKSSKSETTTISMMKTAVGHAIDLIKDILLAVLISLSQGGFAELIKQEEPYIRGVSLILLLLGVLSQQNVWKLLQKINFLSIAKCFIEAKSN